MMLLTDNRMPCIPMLPVSDHPLLVVYRGLDFIEISGMEPAVGPELVTRETSARDSATALLPNSSERRELPIDQPRKFSATKGW